MRARWLVLFVLLATVLASFGVRGQAQAAAAFNPVPQADGCVTDDLPSGAHIRICPPLTPSADLVIWAHGYVAPKDPLTVQDTLPDGSDLANLVRGLGYTFASTSYRSNGMVAVDAQKDILDLLDAFKNSYYAQTQQPFTGRVYLVGASMGGLVVTKLAETNPNNAFAGALAACGIVGDFNREVNYWGDFNVLHNYFFPGVLPKPSDPLDLENASTYYWKTTPIPPSPLSLEQQVTAALLTPTGPANARQLIATAKAAIDPTNPTESTATTIQTLAYFSTISAADMQDRLDGNPFDNRTRWYWGSSNDIRLNLKVERLRADSVALQKMSAYQTTGKPKIPLVMPHTLLDPVVPVDQTLLYVLKARASGNSSKVVPLLVPSYGHCAFTADQLTLSFAALVYKVTGQLPPSLAAEQAASLDFALSEEEVQATLDAFAQAEATSAPDGNTSVYLPIVIQR